MPSILPGYEYDIFISYRQKDNKFDGWVSRFVEDLQNELDATFKEDINIYFDENPHDGLLEMHDVDKSLETKLKSLIFIPVLSQTYCDPKSFAWQNEFIAFNRMASEDEYGLDIKLYSGNVSSRIIPIMIRELDAADIKLVENEIGSRLRSIEFIYSAAGVNRPLTPSDSPEKNLNRTYYRDQINKVAYAVKEVIYGMHPDKEKRMSRTYKSYAQTKKEYEQAPEGDTQKKTKQKSGRILSMLASALAIVAFVLLFVYPGWLRGKQMLSLGPGKANIASLAVLPVSNLTGNSELDWIPMSIHDDILMPLSCTRELVVRPKQSTMQFKDSDKSMSDIASTLQVEYVLETAVKGVEDELRLDVRLVQVRPEERYIWTRSYKTRWDEIAGIYPRIVKSVFSELSIDLSDEQDNRVRQAELSNPEIMKLCRRGEYYMQKLSKEDFQRGLQYIQEAMDMDPNDPLPYITLTRAYSTASHIANLDPEAGNLAMAYAKKVLEVGSMSLGAADAYVSLGAHALYHDWDLGLARDYLEQAMDLNPNNAYAHYHYGWYLMLENDYETGMSEFERSIEIDPLNTFFTHNIAWYNIWIGEFDKAIEPAQKTLDMDPDYAYGQAALGLAYAELGRYEEGIDIQLKALEINNVFEHYLGISYFRAGMIDSALMVADRIETYGTAWFNWALLELYAVLGEEEKAMENLEKAYELRQDFIPWLKDNYYLRELRDNERFNEIVNSIEYPD